MYIPGKAELYYPMGTDWSRFRFGVYYRADTYADLFGWDKEIDAQASYSKLTVDEDGTVFGEFAETNLLYAELGMKETRCALRFRVKDGKIVEQAIEQAIGDGPTFEDSLEPFLIWADENAPDELDEIQPEGQISFTAEMAKKWLILIRKWKATLGSSG